MDKMTAIYLGIGMIYALIDVLFDELSVWLATDELIKQEFTDEMELFLKHEDGAKLFVELAAEDKFTKPWRIIYRIGVNVCAWPFQIVDMIVGVYRFVRYFYKKKDS